MVKELQFKRPTTEHLEHIAANMWHEDVTELKAAGNTDILKVLIDSVETSTFTVVACYNDEPLVIYGLRKESILSSKGVAWMLTTTNSKKFKREFMVYTRQVVDAMLNECNYLYNYVHLFNKTSIKWLKVLGFTIEEPVTYPQTNEQFCHFWIRRD